MESGVLYGVAALVTALVLVIITWWRANSAPAPGTPLGSYEVILKYAGQKLHKELEGIVVDATAYFCAPEVVDAFTKILKRDVDKSLTTEKNEQQNTQQEATQQEAKTEKDEKKAKKAKDKIAPSKAPQADQVSMLEDLQSKLKELKLKNVCRVLIVRDGTLFGEKHLLVQFGDPSKLLSEHASHEEESHFSLSLGPVSKGKIDCVSYTLPNRYVFKNARFNIGTVTVHIIKPEGGKTDKDEEDKITLKEVELAKIVLSIPNTLDIEEHLESYRQQIKDQKIALEQMGNEMSAVSTQRDYLLKSVKAFTTEKDGKTPRFTPLKNDVVDYILMFAFPSVCYGIAEYFGTMPLFGVIGGVSIAGIVIYKRH